MTFFWVIMAGAAVGMVFDFYRSFRRWRDWGRVLTFLGDILFSLMALFILIIFLARANELALRFYIIWGSLLGLILYLRLLSRFFLRFYFRVYRGFRYLAGLLHKGIRIPIHGLMFLMEPPFALLRWFSMLLYRIAEFLLGGVKERVKGWWDSLRPPRTNG